MPEIVVKSSPNLFALNLFELWRYKDLFYIFAWRDLKVRYKQTMLGILWAIFQPVVTMVVFTVFFGRFLQLESQEVPYPVFVYLGLVFWNYFSQSLSGAAGSLVEHENIIKKVYFPRLIIPIAGTIAHLVDFILAFLVLGVLMLYFQVIPSPLGLAVFPVLALITFLTAVGIGLYLAAINVKYRDVRYAIPFFIQLLIFVTPVIYPSSIVSEKLRWVLYINPMAGVIDTSRSAFINGVVNPNILLASLAVAIIYFLLGLFYFRKTEHSFADII